LQHVTIRRYSVKEGRKEELASSSEQLLRALTLAAFLTLCLKDLLLQIVRSREEAWQKKPGSLRLASCKGQASPLFHPDPPLTSPTLLQYNNTVVYIFQATKEEDRESRTSRANQDIQSSNILLQRRRRRISSDPLPAKDKTATISNNTTIQLRRCQNHLRNMREREHHSENDCSSAHKTIVHPSKSSTMQQRQVSAPTEEKHRLISNPSTNPRADARRTTRREDMRTAKFKIPVQGRRPLHSENNLCVSL
jgi:hypothetical protein